MSALSWFRRVFFGPALEDLETEMRQARAFLASGYCTSVDDHKSVVASIRAMEAKADQIRREVAKGSR